MPIFYECQRCTACCRWPGQVRVTDADIARLAAFKGMSEHDFIQQFTRLRHDRRGLVLQENHAQAALFLGRFAVAARLALHEDELDVVLDDGVWLVRFAEE